jgi:hypothetical protein
MSVLQNQDGWWGEGDDMFFIDGEQVPSIIGTGSEDYFLGAFAPEIRSTAQPAAMLGTDEYTDLQSFPLDRPGEHVFHFRQAQKGEMTLLLEVEGPRHGERDRQELTHLGLNIGAALTNHNGRTVCHAIGSPSDGMSNDHWVVSIGHGRAAFWHRACAEIKLKRSESYTLTVRLRDVDPDTPAIKVTPMFERSDNFAP